MIFTPLLFYYSDVLCSCETFAAILSEDHALQLCKKLGRKLFGRNNNYPTGE